FTDSCDPDVGLDRYHHVALIEERIEVRRSIDSHARDLCLRQIGRCARRTKQTDGRCGREALEKGSSVHGLFLLSQDNSRRGSPSAAGRRTICQECVGSGRKKNPSVPRSRFRYGWLRSGPRTKNASSSASPAVPLLASTATLSTPCTGQP